MAKKIVGVIHNVPAPSGQAFAEASADIITQVEAIEEALDDLGYRSVRIPFTREVNGFIAGIKESRTEIAVNLCETVDEDPCLAGHPAAMLELLDIPFSGSPAMALMLTTDKFTSKQLLKARGIRTPPALLCSDRNTADFKGLKYPVILKPRFQDASIGIEQESIFVDAEALKEGIDGVYHRFGPLMVEEYVEGREFNVSLFGYPTPSTFPLAEIDFSAFPEGLYPIVGYRAKWDTSSFEYYHMPRMFPQGLLFSLTKAIEGIALKAFQLFMLRDYGRVDMRVDHDGKIHVLEVNANPCLSPDAGFAAAAQQAGISYADVVGALVEFIEKRARNDGIPTSRS